jgi:hypothetical protein
LEHARRHTWEFSQSAADFRAPLNVVQPGGVGIATDSPFAPPTGTTASPAEATSTGEGTPFAAWYHFELLPGLVLQLRATASPAVRSAAKRICDEYVGR